MGVIIIPLLQIRALRVRKLKQNHSLRKHSLDDSHRLLFASSVPSACIWALSIPTQPSGSPRSPGREAFKETDPCRPIKRMISKRQQSPFSYFWLRMPPDRVSHTPATVTSSRTASLQMISWDHLLLLQLYFPTAIGEVDNTVSYS